MAERPWKCIGKQGRCTGLTQHGTGFCVECRTRKCRHEGCTEEFTVNRRSDMSTSLCALHRKNFRLKIARIENQNGGAYDRAG